MFLRRLPAGLLTFVSPRTGISALKYGNGEATRIDRALLLAGKEGFAERNGARSGVNKVQFSYSVDMPFGKGSGTIINFS